MTSAAIATSGASVAALTKRTYGLELKIAATALLAVVAMQFPLIWQRAINWDEFYHYSQVVAFANGTLTSPLQSLQARMFAWVLQLPGSGIDHIVVIRSVMFCFELVAAASIAAIATRFTDKVTGLIAATAYIGGGFVFQHGFAFRADPMLAGLLTASMWLLLCKRLNISIILMSGVLIGTAAMVSIKAVLFTPAFAGIAWLRWNEEARCRGYLGRLCALGMVSAMAVAIIYVLHSMGLTKESDTAAKLVVSNSAHSMFGVGLQYQQYVFKQILLAPVMAALVVLFPGTLFRSRYSPSEKIALIGLFAPLLTLVFYRNALPYYYAFILPPAIAALSIVIAEFRAKFGTFLVASLFFIGAFFLWAKESSDPIRNQRTVMAAAEKMFPKKVAYIDFCAFLGSFPKANAFLTSWGIELYKAGQYPTIKHVLETKPVPLVISNHPLFSKLFNTSKEVPELLAEDAAVMRATYIKLWGPYWIAGRHFAAGTGSHKFHVLVPGPYTVRAAKLAVNGTVYTEGDVIELDRGPYSVTPLLGDAKLVWGNNVKVPEQPAPTGPYWTPF